MFEPLLEINVKLVAPSCIVCGFTLTSDPNTQTLSDGYVDAGSSTIPCTSDTLLASPAADADDVDDERFNFVRGDFTGIFTTSSLASNVLKRWMF